MSENKSSLKAMILTAAILFFVFSWIGIRKGQEGIWHAKCIDFWQKKNWAALQTLAQNLDSAGRSDAETLYFGMLSANQLHDAASTRELGKKFLAIRPINLKMESQTSTVFKATNAREFLSLIRTKAILGLWLALAFLQLLYLARQNVPIGAILVCSVAGILLVLV